MFRDWDNFYLIVGSAAGALIGLMFVVATLTTRQDPDLVSRGGPVYVTPIVFHFAVVMVVSVMAAVPGLPLTVMGVFLAVAAVTGFCYAAVTTKRIFEPDRPDSPDLSDKCFYGILPAVIYLALAGAAAAIWLAPDAALYATGAVMLVLLLIGIRNAWDLATTLAQRAR
jgi:hypothetical protein